MASRRSENRLALNFFNVHKMILPDPSKTKKPTVGFQARFFWEGFEPCKFLAINGLQAKKSPKTGKNAK
jgi:hypothetical protein